MTEEIKNDSNFVDRIKELYGHNVDFRQVSERYTQLASEHINRFGEKNIRFFSSPGRIEICGNHTDHNHGKVLCASVTVDTLSAVTLSKEKWVKIYSHGYPLIEVNIDELKKVDREKSTSTALVRGVAAYLINNGYKVGGFCATTTSNVFRGAGVSSSSSFECLIAEIFNQLYNNGELDAITKAKASQYAECEYFGKPCGLLDQSAIALGGVSYIDFANPETPVVEKLSWTFEDTSIVLVNTGGDHCNLTNCYADIKTEMEEVANFFGKVKLRELEEEDFYAALPILKTKFSGRALLRAIHFFRENKRVDMAVKTLKNKDDEFFDFIEDSGASSMNYLQNCYPPSDTAQNIPLALSIAHRLDGVKAARVHGGGFAGTIIIFADKTKVKHIADTMKVFYGADSVFEVDVRASGACDTGMKLID